MEEPDDILNFTGVDPLLASSGQPRPDQFALLARHGFVNLVNLATQKSTGHLPEEPDLCLAAGLGFTWMPVEWDSPALEDYLSFQSWLDENRGCKTLVHCAKNWRASLFVALYRVIREGLPLEAGREAVLGVWRPDPVWEAFSRRVLAAHGLPLIPF